MIRNAIQQGTTAARAIAENLKNKPSDLSLDLVIVGAGPAGMSAALEAHRCSSSCSSTKETRAEPFSSTRAKS